MGAHHRHFLSLFKRLQQSRVETPCRKIEANCFVSSKLKKYCDQFEVQHLSSRSHRAAVRECRSHHQPAHVYSVNYRQFHGDRTSGAVCTVDKTDLGCAATD